MTIPTNGTFRMYDISLRALRVVTLLKISVASMHGKHYQDRIPPPPPNILWARDTHWLSQKASGILPLGLVELDAEDFGLTSCSISHLDKWHVLQAGEQCPGLCPQLHPRQDIHPLTLPGFPCPSSSSQIISLCFQSPVPGCRIIAGELCPCTGSRPHVPGCSTCRAGFFPPRLILRACKGSQGVLQISKNIRIEGKEEASLTIVC